VMFGSYLGDHTLGSKVEGAGPKFFYSITATKAKKRIYLKLVNAESTPQALDIDFTGTKLAGTAKLVTLSAHDTQATNSIDDPKQIVPVETALHNVTNHISRTLPAFSIQVIEFEEQ